MAMTIFDEKNSNENEDRWITLGQTEGRHYVVVVHTYVDQSDEAIKIRMISARPATKHEIKQYEG